MKVSTWKRKSHLGGSELTGGQVLLHLLHLLAAFSLAALQLLATLHHGFHLRLHFADVETGSGELFIDDAATLLLLRFDIEKSTETSKLFSVCQTPMLTNQTRYKIRSPTSTVHQQSALHQLSCVKASKWLAG